MPGKMFSYDFLLERECVSLVVVGKSRMPGGLIFFREENLDPGCGEKIAYFRLNDESFIA